jgi:HEAT repeat protein
LEASQNHEPHIRIKAIEALGRLGAQTSLTTLRSRLREGEVVEKRAAALALGRMGEDGLNTLRETMKSSDKTTRSIALEIFEEIEHTNG